MIDRKLSELPACVDIEAGWRYCPKGEPVGVWLNATWDGVSVPLGFVPMSHAKAVEQAVESRFWWTRETALDVSGFISSGLLDHVATNLASAGRPSQEAVTMLSADWYNAVIAALDRLEPMIRAAAEAMGQHQEEYLFSAGRHIILTVSYTLTTPGEGPSRFGFNVDLERFGQYLASGTDMWLEGPSLDYCLVSMRKELELSRVVKSRCYPGATQDMFHKVSTWEDQARDSEATPENLILELRSCCHDLDEVKDRERFSMPSPKAMTAYKKALLLSKELS